MCVFAQVQLSYVLLARPFNDRVENVVQAMVVTQQTAFFVVALLVPSDILLVVIAASTFIQGMD